MTKKIVAVAIAVMMVMALSVVAFANVDVTADIDTTDNTCYKIAIPEGIDVSDGATVKLHIKGTSNNEAIRVYLSDSQDNARVTDVTLNTIPVENGAFEAVTELVINFNGGWGGTSEPTTLILKGEAYGVVIDGTFEVVEFIVDGDDVAPAEEAPAEETPAEEAPAEETAPAEEAPATNEAPAATAPKTGIAFAVVPAIVAMAAVAVSKKR